MREVFLLGSTGSIGVQTLEVIAQNPHAYRVRGLAAGGNNLQLLAEQCLRYRPDLVAVADSTQVPLLRELIARGSQAGNTGDTPLDQKGTDASAGSGRDPANSQLYSVARDSQANIDGSATLASWSGCGYRPEILGGEQAASQLCQAADGNSVVLNGITGGIGLLPTLTALEQGATLALANKESLVVGGALVKQAMVRPGQIVPVDSEHCAIAQCLRSGIHHRGLTSEVLDGQSELAQIILTASGGPFRNQTRRQLQNVTPKQALNHPTWNMGPVVTINSSTLVNKGLELIEAHLLFDLPAAQIVPIIHPQSLVHSMVTWKDGATIAQVSPPDMRLPIALGLSWPRRLPQVTPALDWSSLQSWDFEPVDNQTFPSLELAKYAVAASATHPAVYNAANEVLVQAFLDRRLSYLGIVDTLEKIVHSYPGEDHPDYGDILQIEIWAKAKANEAISFQS